MNIIYLRKSREDEKLDDTLRNHRMILIDLCKKNNWDYEIYEEIATSMSIDNRTEIKKVIDLILEKKVKRLICIDLDRLSRDFFDYGYLLKIIKENNVLIVTPYKNYDLNRPDDLQMAQMKVVFGEREYEEIKNRFERGKKGRAKDGYMTNGKPPLGYWYDRNTRSVLIEPEKAKIYRWLVEKYLTGDYSTNTLAIEFNKYYVGNKGRKANSGRIFKILTNRFYLGEVKYKDNWYKGRHEPLITLEEYNQIQKQLKGNLKVPQRKGYKEIKALSQICKCGCCGHTLTVRKREKYGNLLTCWYQNSNTGEYCKQKGVKEQIIIDILNEEILSYIDVLKQSIENKEDTYLQKKINRLKKEVKDIEKHINKLRIKEKNTIEMTQEGILSIKDCKEELEKIRGDISNLENDKNLILDEINNNNKDIKQELEKFEDVYKGLKDATPEEYNKLVRTIVNKIIVKRIDKDNIEVDIHFI